MHLPRHRLPAFAALTAAGALMAACGSSSSAASPTSHAASAPKVPLVVYAAEGYDQAEVTAFQQATGIPTQLVDHSTGTLLAKISAERNNPQWGVFWSDGAESYAALDQEHLLVRGFEPTAGTLTALGKEVVPADKSYVPTGLTVAAAVIYNSTVVKNPPTTWSQLLDPQWKGAVGMNNPAISGPTYPFVAGVMQQLGGVAQGEQFFTQLKNNGLHVYTTNKVTLTALLNGTIKLALVQNSAGIGFQFTAPQLKVAYPSRVNLLPSVIGIDAKAPKQEIAEAEQFANFVYSAQGQAVQLSGDPHGDSLFFPVIQGTTALPQVPDVASLPTEDPNPAVWGPREASIDQWFTDNIVL
ncbi:MAG: extracellular solute-binding protein [Actinomycetota bacterium]|jgi:iron(III) transport system substrate-binding protein|nr:extracellular solute-binding protein [Actinomycetota bacterium]